MEERKNRRSVRLALVLGAAVAGTALVGWGGLAAWQAYTQNSGNAFAVGSLTHTNVANGGVTCTSQQSVASAATNACQVIVSGSALTPAWPGSTGTVTIENTGQLTSTFALSSPPSDLPTGALCADLGLSISDSNGTYWSTGAISTATGIPSTALNTSAGSSSWAQGASNTFTFSVTPVSGFSSNNSVPGSTCTFDVLFTQAA
jgi:hypothetical protein